MRPGTRVFTALTVAAAVTLGLSGAGEEPGAALTRPTQVTLDFRGRPVGEVTKSIEKRTGKRVSALGTMTKGIAGFGRPGGPADARWRDRTVTLEAPEPVPFWEAMDRLAEVGRIAYRLGEFGDTGAGSTGVVFEGDGDAPGPACYAGPFRVGLSGVHEHRDAILVRGAWVRVYPSGVPVPADAAELASAPKDGGPLYVELQLMPEPGLVVRRDGPLEAPEVVDESDRSLLAPVREDERQSFDAFASVGGGIAPTVRVPLQRPGGGKASKTIKRLRGEIPVEVAVVQTKPAVVIPLGSAEGKTFRGGGAEFTVQTDRIEPDGRRKIAVSCRLTDEEKPPVRDARLAALRSYQLRVVDARGTPVRFSSAGSGGDGRGTLSFTYEYTPGQPPSPSGPPVEFRYHDLDRVTWRVPFEFHDIPLP